jgi:molybdate transport system ATP-binding protein
LHDTAKGIDVATERRPIGFVFQDYLLFPHLTVVDNVAFGLRARGEPRSGARAEAMRWLQRMELGERAQDRPKALSGGQAQRVALARALIVQPQLLLLDEPLAALDVSARVQLRRRLKRQLDEFTGTRLLVTHDPLEAMSLADRVVVLEDGRVVQSGVPQDLSARPRSAYVADLVGINLFRGRARGERIELSGGGELVAARAPDGEVFATIHPQAVALHLRRPEGTPRNVYRGPISSVDVEAERVRVGVGGAPPLIAEITPAALRELGLREGDAVWASVKATEVIAYPA